MLDNLRKRNVIVTGANGLIGSSICRFFETHNINFLAVSQSENRFFYENYLSCDLTLPGVLDNSLDNNSIVFHCASNTSVSDSISDPFFDLQTNFLLFFQVLESVRKSNAALVLMSTGSVYDPKVLIPKNEDSDLFPVSPYSAGKLSAEYYCKVYVEAYKLEIKIVRIFSIYGIGINRYVIYDLINKCKLKPSFLKIRGSGDEIRDFIHISDLVRACCYVAEYGKSGEVYNVASGQSISIFNLTILIRDLMGLGEIEILRDSESFLGDNKFMVGDIGKLESLGFKNEKSFIDGLNELILSIKNG
jgi:UDP-glucose 4-epimerase